MVNVKSINDLIQNDFIYILGCGIGEAASPRKKGTRLSFD